MPIRTVICPTCAHAITADIPPSHRATLEHRDGIDLLRVTPRVLPIPNKLRWGSNASNNGGSNAGADGG